MSRSLSGDLQTEACRPELGGPQEVGARDGQRKLHPFEPRLDSEDNVCLSPSPALHVRRNTYFLAYRGVLRVGGGLIHARENKSPGTSVIQHVGGGNLGLPEKDLNEVAQLYSARAATMRALARQRLADSQEAEDIVQETFRILSERSQVEKIRNPNAFLMTVLNRQINSHLRIRYRRRLVPIDGARDDHMPLAPDAAQTFQRAEDQTLVRESLSAIRSPRQRRILRLTSLNLKPGEIALMETEAGQPATSHQISCVLRRSLQNLRIQLRQRGLVPSFLPAFWWGRKASRTPALSSTGFTLQRVMDGGIALHLVLGATVAGLLVPRLFPPSGDEPVPRPRKEIPAKEESALAPSIQLYEQPAQVDGSAGSSAPGLENARTDTLVASSPGRTTGGLAGVPPAGNIPSPPSLRDGKVDPHRSSATISPADRRVDVWIEPVAGEQTSVSYWEESATEPAPPLLDQTQALVNDPGSIPKPECGGLPICKDPEGDDPPGES